MLIRVSERWESVEWFEEAAKHLEEEFGCAALPKKSYLTLTHLCTLLNKTTAQVMEWLVKNKQIHGVIVRQTLYVHPTKFSKWYMKKMMRNIDKAEFIERPYLN